MNSVLTQTPVQINSEKGISSGQLGFDAVLFFQKPCERAAFGENISLVYMFDRHLNVK